MPVGADEVVDARAHCREDAAVHKYAQIPLRIRQKIGCSTYRSKNLAREKKAWQYDHKGHQEKEQEGVAHNLFHQVAAAFPQLY